MTRFAALRLLSAEVLRLVHDSPGMAPPALVDAPPDTVREEEVPRHHNGGRIL
jgi:hypothetical protein